MINFSVYDASGYYSGGIYAGNNVRKGNPQLCRDLNRDVAINTEFINEIPPTIYDDIQDFLISSNYLPFTVKLVNVKYKMKIENAPYTTYNLHQTVCLPKSCSYHDLQQVMSYAPLSHLRNNLIVKNTELIELRVLEENYLFYKDGSFYLFL